MSEIQKVKAYIITHDNGDGSIGINFFKNLKEQKENWEGSQISNGKYYPNHDPNEGDNKLEVSFDLIDGVICNGYFETGNQ